MTNAEEKRQVREERRTVRLHWLDLTARKMPPTQKHTPAIWEMMLGTVYAMNADGETKYFDYDYAGAKEFAQVDQCSDLRWSRPNRRVRYSKDGRNEPKKSQKVLWVRR